MQVTDSNGAVTSYTYDALNRRLSETATEASLPTMQSTWTYDNATSGDFGLGRLATMTDPSGTTSYVYERRGNIAVQNEKIVSTQYSQAYTYDGNANLATVTYPDGYVVTTTYDFADRPYSSTHTSTLDEVALATLGSRGRRPVERATVPEAPPHRTPSIPSPVQLRSVPMPGRPSTTLVGQGSTTRPWRPSNTRHDWPRRASHWLRGRTRLRNPTTS